MNLKFNRLQLAKLAAVLLLAPQVSISGAEEERPPFMNQSLAVEIEADEAELSEQQDVSVYRGNVILRRGPLTMQGDELRIARRAKDGQIRATLSGLPATATHKTSLDEEPVRATAEKIIYTTIVEILELKGKAEIKRGPDRLQGNNVRYDVANARIEADGGKERVRIVINPAQTPQASPQP